METKTLFNMTRKEAQLVIWMGQALETNRLNPLAPTFTSQALAEAIDGLPGVMCRPNQREIGGILVRMGVTKGIRNYRRNTKELAAVLPEWKAEAKRVLSREIYILGDNSRLPSCGTHAHSDSTGLIAFLVCRNSGGHRSCVR